MGKDTTKTQDTGAQTVPETIATEPTTQARKPFVFPMYDYGTQYPNPLDPRRWMRPEFVNELTTRFNFNWIRHDKLCVLGERFYQLVQKEQPIGIGDGRTWDDVMKPTFWTTDGQIVAGSPLNNGTPEFYMAFRDMEAHEAEKKAIKVLSDMNSDPTQNANVTKAEGELAADMAAQDPNAKLVNNSKRYVGYESLYKKTG